MRSPREAAPGEVAPYFEESRVHEFVGDLKIIFALLTVLSLALAVFLLLFGAGGALLAGGLLFFSAGGWVTMAIVDAKAWKTHRSARDAANEVSRALGGEVSESAETASGPAAALASSAGAASGADAPPSSAPRTPEPGASYPSGEAEGEPPAEAARQLEWGGRIVVGFLLVALVLAAALLGTNRLGLGLLLFFVLAVSYGWPFVVAGMRDGGKPGAAGS